MSIEAEIRTRLSELQLRRVATGYPHEAAVLMPVFEKDGEPHFLLTRRTEDVQTHRVRSPFPAGWSGVTEAKKPPRSGKLLKGSGSGKGRSRIPGPSLINFPAPNYRLAH